MSFQCLLPRIAVQKNEGDKPIFLRHQDYEFALKSMSKSRRVLLIPCGQCVNCQKRKSQEWTSRLLKEAEQHKYCYFITLTYDDKHLKEINKRDIQLFLKRYRKKFGLDLKYYICGEHGETSSRSHYHGIFFQDKEISDLKYYANNLFISSEFAKVWSLGNCLISKQVNESSIKYTIAYTMKKIGEEKIVLMSKGIGLDYFINNKESIKDCDGFYVTNGYKQRQPTYFKRKLKESNMIEDIMYLKQKEDEPQPSTLLEPDYIDNLLRDFLDDSKRLNFKGKGDF